MSAQLDYAATVNNWRTTIADAISDVATIIGLVSTASLNPSHLTAPGVLVLDRVDLNDTATASKREYISFASLSGATLYAVTRGVAGSTAQSHSAGIRIEDVPSVTHWNDLVSYLQVEHTPDGTHDIFSHVRQVTITGVSGASGIRGDVVFVPGSNISIYATSGASGYSWINIAGSVTVSVISPMTFTGFLSAASTNITPLNVVEDATTIKSISAVLKAPVSSASLVLDVNRNFTTLFTDQNTRLSILGGGTYASTASVAVKALTSGQVISLDIDNAGGKDLTVLIET